VVNSGQTRVSVPTPILSNLPGRFSPSLYITPRMMKRAVFVYSDELASYDLGPDHPLKPVRLRMTHDLLQAYDFFRRAECPVIPPRPATREEILLAHKPEYVGVVEEIGRNGRADDMWKYGFGQDDNPPFKGMYEASLLYAGASVVAAEKVLSGEAELAFAISGGLHHAMPARASGFCVFNDPVIAIRRLLEKFERVAYIDVDAHHGDGVQAAFYVQDSVLTISLHESGRWLFPGTGFPDEWGEGAGRGYSINLPFAPGTGDETYTEAFEAVVPAAVSAFQPEVIVAQLGADSHFEDPLAHLMLGTRGWRRIVERIGSFGTPMVALGGGGYHLPSTCRMWAIASAVLCGVELSPDIPAEFAQKSHIRKLDDERPPNIMRSEAEFADSYAREAVDVLLKDVVPLIRKC